MLLVLGKDDRLPETVAARHLYPPYHQMLQHLVDGIRVEQPLVDPRRIHPVRDVPLEGQRDAGVG